ncbi:MAG: terminase family protein [Sphaerospermopsis sp.]|nr:terminase family protein [Sphaerospermopsis sp.]
MELKPIRPQEGFQTKFLSSSADIVFGGSGAGVGKTFALLIEPIRHIIQVKGFGAVIFRRTTPQITNEGGLWDTSVNLYSTIAKQKESSREWIFNNGNKLKFSHLEYEKDAYSWQGSQIPFIGFDELTHFTKKQFFYLLSRNRSVCGIKPYVRATLNPDPDSWVAEFIEWYINQDTGYPIKERIGKIRYFMVNTGEIIWGDTKNEVYTKMKPIIDALIDSNPDSQIEDYIKSFTFITGSIYENKELMKANPEYLANLLAQSEEEQLRLLYGNWKHVRNDTEMYDFTAFKDMFGSLKSCKSGTKYMTADIAMQGADKYIVIVWDGLEVIDIEIIDKTDGKMVLDSMKGMAQKHGVSNSRIIYDNDGVGSYLGGFIPNGIPFHNNKAPLGGGKRAYINLKSQCYYTSAQMVNEGQISISDEVGNKRYDDKMTVKERFFYERKAIRKAKPDMDNKLSTIRKDEMKPLIGGQSPDLMDCFMMRAYFFLGQSF